MFYSRITTLCLRPPSLPFTGNNRHIYNTQAAWAPAQKPLGEFSPFHRVGPRVEYSTDSLCRLSLSNADSRRDLHSSLRSSDAAIQHLKPARVPSRLSDRRKGCMRRCTRKLRTVAYHQLLIPPRPALRFWPSPELSSLCTRVE
jgi:hypothetical protein